MITYTCEQCGDKFDSDWPPDEALQEARDNGFDVDNDEMVVVCDDCYHKMHSLLPFPADIDRRLS